MASSEIFAACQGPAAPAGPDCLRFRAVADPASFRQVSAGPFVAGNLPVSCFVGPGQASCSLLVVSAGPVSVGLDSVSPAFACLAAVCPAVFAYPGLVFLG